MRSYYLLSMMGLILCLTAGKVKAQSAPIGPSPDSKMLGGSSVANGLSNITVPDLFNGSVNINVPIYSFTHDNEDYGVSINYNTQGVKVDEFSSVVGLHWNLNYGSSIVRIVRDLPDEILETTDSLMATNALTENLDDTLIYVRNKEMHVYGRLSAYTKDSATLKASNAYYDKECDEFILSLNGSPFKFYIGKNLKIFSTSSRYVKIQLLAGNVPVTNPNQLIDSQQSVLNFKITDNKGATYYFQPYAEDQLPENQMFWDWEYINGTDSAPPDSIRPYFSFEYPTSWRLKEITFPDGKKITYRWYFSGYGYPAIQTLSPQQVPEDYLNYYALEDSTEPNELFVTRDLGISKPNQYMLPALPSEIDYPNNIKALFLYDSFNINVKYENFLKEIKIVSGDNCKRFRFFQDSTNGRYYLDSIVQASCDSSKEEPYFSFTYNPIIETNPDTVYSVLPKRLYPAQDLYGYYDADSMGVAIDNYPNNIEKQISIPRHHPNLPDSADYGNEREYNATYAQAGLLTSVKNAYGGVEHFYYGPNILNSVPLNNMIPTDNDFIGTYQPDGVCIDSIVKTDSSKPGYKLTTTFQYSGGQLFMPGGYFDYPVYIDSITGKWERWIYQSEFLTAHQLINNSNHGYSNVIVANKANGQLLSKKEYLFTNMEDSTSNGQPRYYHVPGSKDYFDYPYTNKQYLKSWEIGLPLTITSYDQNNHIVNKIINHYDFSKPIDLSSSAYIANARTEEVNSGTYEDLDGFVPSQYYDWYYPYKKAFIDHYYPFKGIAPLDYTVSQKYVSDTRFIADTVWFDYDDHNNLVSTITQNSKGQQTETRSVYNYDVDGPTLTTNHPGTTLYNMTDSGLEVVVSTERWRLNPQMVNGNQLLSAFITKYQYQNGKLWTEGLLNTDIGKPVPFTDYAGNPVNNIYVHRYDRILSAYNTSDSVADFIKTSNVILFDPEGNPLESQLLNQDQYKAMVWNPLNGQKIADAANCRYSDIAYTSFEDSLKEGNLACSNPAAIIVSGLPVTGTHVGLLWTQTSPGTAVSFHGTQNLDTGKAYILSFWVSGTPPQIKVGSQSVPVTSASLVYTKGIWSNYQVRFVPAAVGELTITGVAPLSLIDEIRLYPAGAQMQSWTFDPLFGKSSYTSPSGRITYYQYDKMGRLNMVLDQDGNILSKADYHVAH